MVKFALPHPVPIKNPTSPFRNFNFMRPIKIVGSDTDLYDYQVRIHLDRSNFPLEKCKPDGSDIRFRDDSGEIIPYWIERWNVAEGVVWCKIPYIPAESSKYIWMIYGNPNAQSESNGDAVFELFDVQDIVGFWHLDESHWTGATGEVKDETGVNHGTAYGGATTTSDAKYGRAGLFDGVNDYVQVPDDDSLDITDEITIELWAKANSWETTGGVSMGCLLWKPGCYGIMFDPSGQVGGIIYRVDDDPLYAWTTSFALETEEWYHIVGVYDGESVYTYINGAYASSIEYPGSISTNSISLLMGGYYTTSRHFNGTIDEACIYKRALSPTEIEILYNNYMEKMGAYFNVRKYVTPPPVVIV